MKALSLWQPWASLVVHRLKQYETRGWACPPSLIGKPIAIHATKALPAEAREIVEDEDYADEFDLAFRLMGAKGLDSLPRGAVLGVARVVSCQRASDVEDRLSVREATFGNYGPGRFAWRLEVVERFAEPIPAKGRQGIWEWTDPRALLPLHGPDRPPSGCVVSDLDDLVPGLPVLPDLAGIGRDHVVEGPGRGGVLSPRDGGQGRGEEAAEDERRGGDQELSHGRIIATGGQEARGV